MTNIVMPGRFVNVWKFFKLFSLFVILSISSFLSFTGSLMNLAKHPASTVQILGAEKALFRALKARKDTPKYGLIYHASLVGQSNAKNKGKVGLEDFLVLFLICLSLEAFFNAKS